MKILKIFGIVVGIHVFALILIFANPGCSSTSKQTPAPSDTMTHGDASATVNVPMNAAPNFNPDAPATANTASTGSTGGIRFTPTRPNTPAAGAVTAAPVADVTPASTYSVKAGDTLWELGKKFHIPYAEIAAANNLKAGSPLHAGQKLIIPGSKPSVAAAPATGMSKAGATAKPASNSAPAPTASGNAMKHTVKPGESLSGIAKQYGVTTKELGTANNISDPQKIQAGMELIIPGWNAAGGLSGKATKSGSKSSDTSKSAAPAEAPKSIFNLDPNAPKPAGNEPPVIKVEDNPLSPAPKGN
jgi:LysM repeat protein